MDGAEGAAAVDGAEGAAAALGAEGAADEDAAPVVDETVEAQEGWWDQEGESDNESRLDSSAADIAEKDEGEDFDWAENEDESEALRLMVEELAEKSAERLEHSSADEILEFLAQAQALAAPDLDTRAPCPSVVLARAAVSLLQCAVLSRSSMHGEAHAEAAKALSSCEHLWCAVLRAPGDAERLADRLREVLAGPPVWLGWAVEIAVQAKQCVALELEFKFADGGEDLERADELHRESVMIADELLAHHHPLRRGASIALTKRLNRMRETTWSPHSETEVLMEAARLGSERPSTMKLVAALTGLAMAVNEDVCAGDTPRPLFLPVPTGVTSLARPTTELSSSSSRRMPLKERIQMFYEGRPPTVDPGELRQRYLAATRGEVRPGSTVSMGKSVTGVSIFGPYDGEAFPDHQGFWKPNCSAPPQVFKRKEGQALRRVYCGLNMSGTGGRATWALRNSARPRKKPSSDGRLDAFTDWKLSVYGSTDNRLRTQVMKTDKGMRHFQDNIKGSSERFKRFWLREEVDSDGLHDDRILFCGEGMRLKSRQEASRSQSTGALGAGKGMMFTKDTLPLGRKRPAASPKSIHAAHLYDLKEMLSESQIRAGLVARKPPPPPKPRKEDSFAGLMAGSTGAKTEPAVAAEPAAAAE